MVPTDPPSRVLRVFLRDCLRLPAERLRPSSLPHWAGVLDGRMFLVLRRSAMAMYMVTTKGCESQVGARSGREGGICSPPAPRLFDPHGRTQNDMVGRWNGAGVRWEGVWKPDGILFLRQSAMAMGVGTTKDCKSQVGARSGREGGTCSPPAPRFFDPHGRTQNDMVGGWIGAGVRWEGVWARPSGASG